MRGVAVETVKEGGSKAPGFSRDLCEIPAMPRVKKKTALRCVPIPTRPLTLPPYLPPPLSSLRVVVWKWKWPGRIVPPVGNLPLSEAFSDGTVKRTAIYTGELTPTGSRLPEVICRDTVINANRKIAGTIGRGLG